MLLLNNATRAWRNCVASLYSYPRARRRRSAGETTLLPVVVTGKAGSAESPLSSFPYGRAFMRGAITQCKHEQLTKLRAAVLNGLVRNVVVPSIDQQPHVPPDP